jgi:hypothetical protein
MKKDFAFMFKPGDYLRDTQCLSEKAQVAYDRIMCEHMRNICISQQQLNFFTKKMNPDEREELLMVLEKVEGGYQIEWVVVSISERMAYRESRSKNRLGKTKNISKSYDAHMEGEGESISENVINTELGEQNPETEHNPESTLIAPKMVTVFKTAFPDYPISVHDDYDACVDIAVKIAKWKGWKKSSITNGKLESVLNEWKHMVNHGKSDRWFSTQSIADYNKQFQRLIQKINSNVSADKSVVGKTDPTGDKF